MSKNVKIDIIIETVKLNDLIDILVEEGVPGYTVFGGIIGRGESGQFDRNFRNSSDTNSYLFVVCDEELSKRVLKSINVILEYYSGACFVSEVTHIEMYHREK